MVLVELKFAEVHRLYVHRPVQASSSVFQQQGGVSNDRVILGLDSAAILEGIEGGVVERGMLLPRGCVEGVIKVVEISLFIIEHPASCEAHLLAPYQRDRLVERGVRIEADIFPPLGKGRLG